MTPRYLYALATGYNVALLSLTNIETIKPSGDKYYFYPPAAYMHASPGVRHGRLNGVGFRAGFAKVDWVFSAMTQKQYDYLNATFCGGTLSGKVTIYSRVNNLAYARYNAVIDIPETEATQGDFAFLDVPIHLTHLVPL